MGSNPQQSIILHLGPFIARRRNELGLSLQLVADRAGVTKAHIWDLEKSRSTNPSIGVLVGLCGALQCNLESLIGPCMSKPLLTDNEWALINAHRRIFGEVTNG